MMKRLKSKYSNSLLSMWLVCALLLNACGGDSGGDRAQGIVPGPNPPDTTIRPPLPLQPSSLIEKADQIIPVITAANIPEDGRPIVGFQISDGNKVAILDVNNSNVRFIIAKLQSSPLGNNTGSWQSYINRIEIPTVGVGTEPRMQATTESNGDLVNNGDGTYTYRFATSINSLSSDILAQAEQENLNLRYEPSQTHRIAIQFSGAANAANPIFDFVPATGEINNISHYNVVATENCNRCHNKLALHGGGRIEARYCVTCHNPGSTDANSTNSVDFKTMIHKIHHGAQLPSIKAGGEYVIYGFRNSLHDYSGVIFPQDIRNCKNCHTGSSDDGSDLVLTSEGDNWAQFANRAACGSCHDDVEFSTHAGGQVDDSYCMDCHSAIGVAGSIQSSHLNPVVEVRKTMSAEVIQVDNTAPGDFPIIYYRVYNPQDNTNYDLLTDPIWAAGRLALTLGWSTSDIHNTGNNSTNASSVSINAISSAVANGDGTFYVNSPFSIPDGSVSPFVAAAGSGISILEGRAAVDVDGDGSVDRIPLANAHAFFSINEPDAIAKPRRQSADYNGCKNCHESLVLHGGNRSDNLNSCVTCHNPRNTDRDVRELSAIQPKDGLQEQSLDFKVIIHAIHAAGFREKPIEIVGFRGLSVNRFDESVVHFPGLIRDCSACHTDSGYQLPLASTVLATTVDTGIDRLDPEDDIVVSPVSAVCSSCHDGAIAKAHMITNGGRFSTSQKDIDEGSVVEQCVICHGAGGSSDVKTVHYVE